MRISIKTKFILIVALIFAFIYQIYIRNYEVTIAGYINQADSYGRQSIDLYRMIKDDVEVNFHHVRSNENGDLSLNELIATNNPNISLGKFILLEAGLSISYKDFEDYLTKRLYVDDSWNKIPKEQQIFAAYSMFESSKITVDRVRMINDYLDMVVVPDNAVEKAYLDSGVTKPIFVLPHPIDYNRFAQYPLKLKPNKPFVFMNLSTAHERKNIPKLIEAFAMAFANNADVKLELNSREGFKPSVLLKIEDVIKKYKLSNIAITKSSYNEKMYVEKMLKADVYVSLSKGEGFSLQPREAMALGIPAIVSDAMAQKTITESGNVVTVPANIAEPAYYDYQMLVVGEYQDCDVKDAANAMRYIYENYQDFTQKNAQAARDWVKQYDYKALKPYYVTMVKPKSVMMGEKNKIEIDKITTNSPELYEKYKKLMD